MKFTKAEEKQINGRFEAMYQLLTKKAWIQGAEAQDAEEEEVEPTSKKATAFCLFGAVRHINGPTEEEIQKLTALQILIQDERLDGEIEVLYDEELVPRTDYPQVDRAAAIIHLLQGENLEEVSIITEWNDQHDRTHAEVRKMLRAAQKLYGKVWAAWDIKCQADTAMGKLNAVAVKTVKL